MTPDKERDRCADQQKAELKATLEHALAQPPETLQRLLGEFLIKLNPPID